ncbi:uncharacterized protein G2W53_015075 [Senna tora]|uniref:Uncharacterized protein n=1 Tax=Senna tora TaxID=362788 RepID=A0A835C966_9FABA|nr:uncharacterized protein G2W53_015075 [Senna tora]
MQKCFGRVKEKKPPPPRKRKCLVWSLFVASLSVAQPLKHSHRRQKLSPSKEDPWPPDRSLGAVVPLHQISWRRRLVATDLAGENAEVLRESEGEKASAAAKEEVFGLENYEIEIVLWNVEKSAIKVRPAKVKFWEEPQAIK